jgi:hypothetical protein
MYGDLSTRKEVTFRENYNYAEENRYPSSRKRGKRERKREKEKERKIDVLKENVK